MFIFRLNEIWYKCIIIDTCKYVSTRIENKIRKLCTIKPTMVIYLWEVQLWVIFHTLYSNIQQVLILLGTNLSAGRKMNDTGKAPALQGFHPGGGTNRKQNQEPSSN